VQNFPNSDIGWAEFSERMEDIKGSDPQDYHARLQS